MRVLIIDDRVPDPSLGAGYGRIFMAALELAAGGYAVAIYPADGVDGAPPDALISAGVAIVPGDLRSHLSCPWNQLRRRNRQPALQLRAPLQGQAHVSAERAAHLRLRGLVLAAPCAAGDTGD